MAFNGEYVGTSNGEIYNRTENSPPQVITEMGESFYDFLTNYRVNGLFPYRWLFRWRR